MNKYDFSFMKEYAELFEVPKTALAGIFQCGINKVDDVLNGKILLKKELVEEICYEQGFRSYEEYKEDILRKISIKKGYKNSFTKESIIQYMSEKDAQIIYEEIQKDKLLEEQKEKKESIIIEDNKPSYIDMIPKEKLFEIINFDNAGYREKMIFLLLFSGIIDKSFDEIANYLNINSSYVKTVYNRALKQIKNNIDNIDIKLEYRIK